MACGNRVSRMDSWRVLLPKRFAVSKIIINQQHDAQSIGGSGTVSDKVDHTVGSEKLKCFSPTLTRPSTKTEEMPTRRNPGPIKMP